ncbi:hypothetical protein LCGC14_0689020 [marine sediment metagenome]|uniref:Uncharacterized protein n=1 Tax=marine sediment metagenome TaxID=412755 RepID=A0A0F9T798_9ZZZZ
MIGEFKWKRLGIPSSKWRRENLMRLSELTYPNHQESYNDRIVRDPEESDLVLSDANTMLGVYRTNENTK